MTLPQPPVLGSVYGFGFKFPPKTHAEVHPGLVFGIKGLSQGKSEVLVAPISHKEPSPHEMRIVIPPEERMLIGLDHQHQCVYFTRYSAFILPNAACKIHRLNRAYVGQASEEFRKEVTQRILEYRRTGY